jgi:uncharacterized protein (TIGR02246 family)
MTNQPRDAVEQVFEGLAAGDAAVVMDAYTEDVSGIDEVSRRWMRGREELAAYTDSILKEISDLRSVLVDDEVKEFGDCAVVTGMVEQQYVWRGEEQSLTMPATFVLRRDDGRWRVCVFHSLPLPE